MKRLKQMTSRERVLKACSFQQPDRTPTDFGGTAMSLCTPSFLTKMRETLGYKLPDDRDATGGWPDEQIQRYLGVDLRLVPRNPPLCALREIDPVTYQRRMDEIKNQKPAVVSDIKTTAVSHNFPLAALSLDEIKQLKPERSQPLPYLDWIISTAKEYRRNGYATTFWLGSGFFELGCWKRGYDQFALDLAGEPELAQAFFDLLLSEKMEWLETIVKPLAPYMDWFCCGDDLAIQTGPFISPDMFRELVKPYLAEFYGKVRAAAPNSYLFHHSCGSVYRLMDDLADTGVQILNPIQPNAFEMEPERIKEKAHGRLCLHGGIDLQDLLPFGKPAEVRAEAIRRMEILGKGGGYVCAPAHGLPEDVPVENILGLFDRV